jgi:hypothetical protein
VIYFKGIYIVVDYCRVISAGTARRQLMKQPQWPTI